MNPSTDIQAHCCGADQLFNAKTAEKQYKQYLKKGPSTITKKLIGQLDSVQPKGTLLDVGGGIGAIQWWFLENGGNRTIGVDASSGYTKVAQAHALEKNLADSTQFFIGDMTDFDAELPGVDHISLDKVICCYPDYKAIIDIACKKSRQSISLSYPMDGVIASIFRGVMVIGMKISGSAFKPYIHRVADVRALFEANGFKLTDRALSFPFHIETYVKQLSAFNPTTKE